MSASRTRHQPGWKLGMYTSRGRGGEGGVTYLGTYRERASLKLALTDSSPFGRPCAHGPAPVRPRETIAISKDKTHECAGRVSSLAIYLVPSMGWLVSNAAGKRARLPYEVFMPRTVPQVQDRAVSQSTAKYGFSIACAHSEGHLFRPRSSNATSVLPMAR